MIKNRKNSQLIDKVTQQATLSTLRSNEGLTPGSDFKETLRGMWIFYAHKFFFYFKHVVSNRRLFWNKSVLRQNLSLVTSC